MLNVQTSPGSFNHGALACLRQAEEGSEPTTEIMEAIEADDQIRFTGTQANTFEQAVATEGTAFVAIENDIVEGRLIPTTAEALQDFEVVEIRQGVLMKIDMCLHRREGDDAQLHTVASHPAALKQIKGWKGDRPIKDEVESKGTSVAAQLLSEEHYEPGVGAVGPKWMQDRYQGIHMVEEAIQDEKDNKTLFAELVVRRRQEAVSIEEARAHLAQIRDILVGRIRRTEERFSHIANVPETGLQITA